MSLIKPWIAKSNVDEAIQRGNRCATLSPRQSVSANVLELYAHTASTLALTDKFPVDHVAGLWQHNGWLNATAADYASLHYGGFSVKTSAGLRIISFNTDFWYKSNFLNFINTTNPDQSGQFKWMIQELQAAEDAGEPVWIIGHVLSGWDGVSLDQSAIWLP